MGPRQESDARLIQKPIAKLLARFDAGSPQRLGKCREIRKKIEATLRCQYVGSRLVQEPRRASDRAP